MRYYLTKQERRILRAKDAQLVREAQQKVKPQQPKAK